MYPRLFEKQNNKSFFIFGPRGTGKSSWLRENIKNSSYIDLLNEKTFRFLLSSPEKLVTLINPESEWIIIDEVQRIPELLNEVHRQIELNKLKFILSGSSARNLKRLGVNLLAGRAITKFMYPFTFEELGNDFKLNKAIKFGLLPEVWNQEDEAEIESYLDSYVSTYLKEEVKQESLVRNLGNFSRFLEVASFSQSSLLNVSNVAREVGVSNKTCENYFTILEDLLLAKRLPVFCKHAKRVMFKRQKFLFFDVGVYRTIRPKGPLDSVENIDGAALETLIFQNLLALNDYYNLKYDFYHWKTKLGQEVDFVLYGEAGLVAIEIKRAQSIRKSDLKSLKLFFQDYPMANVYMLYTGDQELFIDGIKIIPYEMFFKIYKQVLKILV